MKIGSDRIEMRMPDDWHVHLRDGAMLEAVAFHTRHFGRGVAMGNLPQAVATGDAVQAYKKRIEAALRAAGSNFHPLMTVMLAKSTTPQILEEAYRAGAQVLKLIPGQTSTNSGEGISLAELQDKKDVLQCAADLGMVFSGHWELAIDPDSGVAIPELHRERAAIRYLIQTIGVHPNLKIVAEHASTTEMVDLVKCIRSNLAATITAHHLVLTYDQVGEGGQVNPFLYCKPIAKIEADRKALLEAVTSGDPRFFFGSDSAPHMWEAKQKGAAGLFTAPVVLPLLVRIFKEQGCLDKLEPFVSEFGARFYGLPVNDSQICLEKKQWTVPQQFAGIPVFGAGEELEWQCL